LAAESTVKSIMLPLLIASSALLATVTQPAPELYNHTLRGERIPAKEVVCRNRWGTPMLPDGKGGYSLIAPINPDYIAASLVQPPITGGPVFRPVVTRPQTR
jgi:hypothetical protein